MTKTKTPSVPQGLPARFMTDSKEGFADLCKVLEIANRQQQQAILSAEIVKRAVKSRKAGAQKLPTAQRLQTLLTAFYSLPEERRELWRNRTGEVHEVPSLEHHALRSYDAGFAERALEDERLAETLADFPGAVESIVDAQGWQLPAFALWPDLWRDLTDWDALPAGRRDGVILAVFAVATILDDRRFLHWAADRADAIASEFAFLHTADVEEAEQGAVAPEESHTAAPEPQAPGRNAARAIGAQPSTKVDDVIEKWTQTCQAIANCAGTLGSDPPQPERLPDLHSHVRVLEQLRDPVVAFLDASRPEHLVATVADTLEALAGEHDALWLRSEAAQICAQWKLTWLVGDDVDVGSLRADVERVTRELTNTMKDWRESVDAREQLDAELQEIRTEPSESLASQLSTFNQEAQLGAMSARVREHILSVLRVAAPEGHEFEQSRDYVREWLNAMASSDSAPAEATRAAPEPQLLEDVQETAGEANEAASVTPRGEGDQEDSLAEGTAAITEAVSPTDSVAAAAEEHRTVPAEAASESDAVRSEAQDSTLSGSRFENAIAVLWQSVDERPGIAYHMACLLGEESCSDPSLPPADLVAAAMLADSVQSADGAIVAELRPILARIESLDLSHQDAQLQDSVNLMLFSSTLRPALFAPLTGAASLLRRAVMSSSLKPIATFAEVVANQAERLLGLRLDASLLKAASSDVTWEENWADLSARVEQWRNKAEKQHVLAQRVWARWLQKDGSMGRLTRLISKNDERAKEDVEELLNRFSNQKELAALTRETGRGRGSIKGRAIMGKALAQLQTHVQPAVALGIEWLQLMDLKQQPAEFLGKSITELRRDLDRYGKPALRVLDACRTESAPPLRVAAAQARRAVDGLLRIILDDGWRDADRANATPETILRRDLLFVTELDLDAECGPAAVPAAAFIDLLADTGAHAPTMSVACERRLQRGNVVGAHLACDEMEQAADPEVDRCSAALDREVRARKSKLIEDLAQLKEDTEQAFCFGHIPDEERNRLADGIVRVESALDGMESIENGQLTVSESKRSLERSRATKIEWVRESFQEVSGSCDTADRDRIDQCIEDGDLFAANELISQIKNNGTIEPPTDDRDDPFQEFMSALEEEQEIDATAEDLKPAAIVQAAADRGRVAGVSFSSLTQKEAAEAASLLALWYRLATAERLDDSTDLHQLLLSFGFQVRKQEKVNTGRGWAEVSVETDPIQERSICPLPYFGSEANGRYRLLLNWSLPVSESISRTIGRGISDPTIIVHFGRLGPDREKLRQWAITKQQQFLVIDESMAWYLSSRRTKRLSALFRCALPFSVVDPYVTTSGLVPPELFYGRTRDRKLIMDRQGTCFIYGGRQLGKTALLRSVERDFHDPGRRHLAKWVDLKVGEIGSARPADEIWSLLWRELHELPVLSKTVRRPNPGNQAHIDAVIDEIERWINAREDNRFLLLLDEADAFLAADALTDFRESTRLKGLMDRTDRRFKVVLAGLHHVLRVTERSNHPLAHFGEPIRIGPLMTNGEWEQAQKLVREPLLAVGCRFDRDALGTRILGQTNYYPSLIQLYGAELVRQLRDSTKSFPYAITSKDIDAAYRDTGLRNAIRERFHWTLQLDQRYEVVAYALAHDLVTRNAGADDSVPRSEITAMTRGWWPGGFDKTTDAQFNVLLDEMVGLGVCDPSMVATVTHFGTQTSSCCLGTSILSNIRC